MAHIMVIWIEFRNSNPAQDHDDSSTSRLSLRVFVI